MAILKGYRRSPIPKEHSCELLDFCNFSKQNYISSQNLTKTC